MAPDIRFPNLGIEFKNVIKSFKIYGDFEIAMYGIIIATAMIIGIFIAQKRAKETGQSPEFYSEFALWAIIISIIGARLYYVAFSFNEFKGNILAIFNLRTGGLAIYGGIIGAVIATFICSKLYKKSFALIADTAVMGLIAGQAIGRWGNFFNREAFGSYTDSIFAMQIKVFDVSQGNLNSDALTKTVSYLGEAYYQVHPTFLYESLWNLLVLIALFSLRNKTKFSGELFVLYLALYGIGRFFIEGLRTDQLRFAGFAVSQVLALVLVIISIGILFYKRVLKSEMGK